MPLQQQSEDAWKQFEKHVARLYETMGYLVTPDTLIKGKQIDIVAEKLVPGIGHSRIAIECKWRRDKRSIGTDEITAYRSFAENARAEGKISHAIFATNAGYTRFAREACSGSTALTLMTASEIEDQVFDFRDQYRDYVDSYKENRIFDRYISLSGTVSTVGISREPTRVQDVEQWIVDRITSSSSPLVTVLGDFGAGKSTLLEKLKYNFAEDRLEGVTTLEPILFWLKEYHTFNTLDSLVARTLNREFSRDIPLRLFWKFAQEGRFLFLLDGFDEMAGKSDRRRRAELLLELSPLFSSKSKAVLTCRPAYFVSQKEYDRAVASAKNRLMPVDALLAGAPDKFHNESKKLGVLKSHLDSIFLDRTPIAEVTPGKIHTIELSALDDSKINSFLEGQDRRFLLSSDGAFSWKDVREFLGSVYDLGDLIKRPILLDMITETVLAGSIDVSNRKLTIGPTSLYELYTDHQLERDWQKGESRRVLLTKEQRRTFAEATALTMFRANGYEVGYEDIASIAREHRASMSSLHDALHGADPEEITSDILRCSFLTRDADGTFRFIHKSFMEYFVARFLRSRIVELQPVFHSGRADFGEAGDLFRTFWPKDIIYFLGGFGIVDATFLGHLLASQEALVSNPPQDPTAFRNICSTLLCAGRKFSRFKLEKATVANVEIRDARFRECQLIDCEFSETSLSNLQFEEATLALGLAECSANKLNLSGCKGSISLSQTTAVSLSLADAEIQIALSESTLERAETRGGDIFISGNGRIIQGSFYGSRITIEELTGATRDCNFDDCRVTFANGVGSTSNLRFNHCKTLLSGAVVVDESELLGGTVSLQQRATIRKSSIEKTALSIGTRSIGDRLGQSWLTDSVLVSCRLNVHAPMEVTGCRLRNCRVFLSRIDSKSLSLDNTTLRESMLASVSGGTSAMFPVECNDTLFERSTLLGFPISFLEYVTGRADGAQFKECKGFFFLQDSAFFEDQIPEGVDGTMVPGPNYGRSSLGIFQGMTAVSSTLFLRHRSIRRELLESCEESVREELRQLLHQIDF